MTVAQTPGKRVKLARSMLGLTRKDVEDKHSISVNTLQSWELDRISLTEKGAKKLSTAFMEYGLLCSDSWLLNGEGIFPAFLQNDTETFNPIGEDLCILREVEAFKSINKNPIVIIINDDAMSPIYNIGEYVGGNKRTGYDIAQLVGSNCIIETINGDTLVRKLLIGSKDTLFSLACINNYSHMQPIIPDVKLNFAAQIVWHRTTETIK